LKSGKKVLNTRGFLKKGAEAELIYISIEEKIQLLNSKTPVERTIGARLLGKHGNVPAIMHLINALSAEKKLYCRIEICNALVDIGTKSIEPLISMLGCIGSNQHKSVPADIFKKKNYPLPRDIAARALIRFGKQALPGLICVLDGKNACQLSEAIDAIGYICFYEPTREIYDKLRDCYLMYDHNDLIKWKIIRAMSGMPESMPFLKEQKNIFKNNRLLTEISRSLYLIQKRN
jgi:hypothetical protein